MLFRPARTSDLDEICALLATARHPAEHFGALFAADPLFDPAQVRVAWTGGRIVGCAKFYPRVMRLGTLAVPVGGIGDVRTDPRYWQKGIASSLLSECLTAMYVDGLLLAPLFAPRHTLFARRGWHAIPAIRLEFRAKALATVSRGEPPAQVRPFDAHDLDAVMALHESVNAARTGSIVRDRDGWLGCLTTLDLRGAMPAVAEQDGEILGYAVVQPQGERVEVLEMLLAPWAEDVWRPLLRGAVFRAGHAGALSLVAPADYRRLVLAAKGVASAPSDDLMLRVVDPARLLGAIAPLLAARLRDTGAVEPIKVRIGPLRGGAVLHAAGHEVAVTRPRTDDPHVLPEAAFLALLLGAEDAGAQLDALGLPEAAREALLRLFPPQDWVFWRSDVF